MICPRCGSSKLQKKGTRAGKQRYKCSSCSASFTEGVTYRSMPPSILKDPDLKCPRCDSSHVVRDGKLLDGSQRYRCVECGKDFSEKTFQERTKVCLTSLKRRQKVLKMIFNGMSVSQVALKSKYNERTVRAIAQPYYEKEILTKEQKELIVRYGHYLKVPVDYLAEYVPCSQRACKELLKKYEEFKSTSPYAKLKNPSRIYRSFFAQNS